MRRSRLKQTLMPALAVALRSTATLAQDYHGAIAYSQNSGGVGYAYDYDSRAAAEQHAPDSCGEDDCSVVLWFMNGCGALATGDDNAYGTGWASTRREAEDIAMSACNGETAYCSVARWVCTTR
jgi:hypothetical protein